MGILSRYTAQDFLVTFLMTLAIFTFVMCIAAVVKAIDYMARGLSGVLVLKFVLYNLPYLLTFSIPMSTLTSVLLLFSRLSFDGEISAMKACGLSMWQIVAPTILLSILMSGLCVYLTSNAAPKSHYARRNLVRSMGAEDPVNLLEEGRFVDEFPGLMVYVGKKGRKQIRDVVVYELDGNAIVRNVRAKYGEITHKPEEKLFKIDLYDVRIDQPDPEHPMDPSRSRNVTAAHYPVKLDLSRILKDGKVKKKGSDMTLRELIYQVRNIEELYPKLDEEDRAKQRMKFLVEANSRLSLSLSCFAFTLLGIPLGMRSRRKESSVGVGISLLLVFFFYFFIIIAESLVDHPQVRPDLIVWLPVILAEVGGFIMIQRAN